MIRINLIPRKVPKRAAMVRRQTLAIVAPLVIVLAIVYAVHNRLSGQVEALQAEIQTLTSQITIAKAKLKKVPQYKKKKADLEARLKAVEFLNKQRFGPVRIMDTLTTTIPKDMWLESLAESGLQVTITGWASDNLIVSKFMTNLEASPYFQNVELISSAQDDFQLGVGRGGQAFKLKKFFITSKVTYQ